MKGKGGERGKKEGEGVVKKGGTRKKERRDEDLQGEREGRGESYIRDVVLFGPLR